jgi:wyosine [tRNA(Phe)-imidazoG37] synthetase (radical SAM superfamily)
MKYVFGPVPSRRLGSSLGVDLVPFKTCTYDCIYCQLGRTTHKTMERKEWVPLEDVFCELEAGLEIHADYITLSGCGEPTLHSGAGEVIDRIKSMTDIPVAVLTNGSLLWQEEVRRQLLNADVVIPSLDAGDASMFRVVNRPHAGIAFDQLLFGLAAFRDEFRGQYWLEVFLLAGHTGTQSEVRKLARHIERLKPDRIQLNTVSRPPSESFAFGVSPDRMGKLAAKFNPPAEVITSRRTRSAGGFHAGGEAIIEMLRRRPCTLEQIADGLGLHRSEVIKHLQELIAERVLTQSRVGRKLYYSATRDT